MIAIWIPPSEHLQVPSFNGLGAVLIMDAVKDSILARHVPMKWSLDALK